MRIQKMSVALAAIMCAVAVGAVAARPTAMPPEKYPDLKEMVPETFGEWRRLPESGQQVVNPQTERVLNGLYDQILTRSYVNAEGYRIMLSVAYGADQRGGLSAHMPEVCYPAQGFKVDGDVEESNLPTQVGVVEPVRRLRTHQGARFEPVTYWITNGDEVLKNSFQKRWIEIRFALTGEVPDGLLFRVSSIDRDSKKAFALQQKFADDLLGATTPDARLKLSGLKTPPRPA